MSWNSIELVSRNLMKMTEQYLKKFIRRNHNFETRNIILSEIFNQQGEEKVDQFIKYFFPHFVS